MTRKEYLWQLRTLLTGNMKTAELERTIAYYMDYFQNDGREDEAIMAELGTPEALASRLLGFDAVAQKAAQGPAVVYAPDAPGGMSLGVKITLAILLFPVIIAILAVCFAVVVSFAAVAVGLVIGGIVAVFGGLSLILQSGVSTLMWCGTGVALLGVGLLFLPAAVGVGKVFSRWAGRFFRWLTRT